MESRQSRFKTLLREVTPPVLARAFRTLRSQRSEAASEWEYVAEGWAAAERLGVRGWNVASVLEVQRNGWPGFLQVVKGTEPLAVSPECAADASSALLFHNIIMTWGYVLALAAQRKETLSILDWGGGIGHYNALAGRLLPGVALDYHCKDVPLLAAHGSSLFPGSHFHTDDSCLQRSYDLVVASGSLQYGRDWRRLLTQLSAAAGGHLFVTRLPVVRQRPSFVILQRPYRYGYHTEYLGWCVNRGDLVRCAEEAGLELIREFTVGEKAPVRNAPETCAYAGFLFRRRPRAPETPKI